MADRTVRIARRALLPAAVVAAAALFLWTRAAPDTATAAPAPTRPVAASMQEPVPITVVARRYSFSPSRIEVHKDDLVEVTFRTDDIPHSFTLDAYRIAKRAAPDKPVVFEFRADKEGTFPFYCNLSIDEGCRAMRGELVVRPRN